MTRELSTTQADGSKEPNTSTQAQLGTATPPVVGDQERAVSGSLLLDSMHELPTFIHQYLRDFIAFADQKAAFIFAASAALLAYLSERGAITSLQHALENWTLHNWSGVVAFALWTMTGVLAAAVVVPRRKARFAKGVIYWEEIRENSEAGYVETVETLSQATARVEIVRHCYLLAGICQRKYRVLDWALRFGALGLLTTAAFLITE
jgi:hypothetical protein